MKGHKYFFSYARDDSEFVLKLAQELRNRGANLWLDQLDILGGERWDHAIEQSLQACEGMIVVLSADAVDSQNVMDEVSYALEEEKFIIPVLYRECAIPFRLRRVQFVDFTRDFEGGLPSLLKALGIGRPAPALGNGLPEEPALENVNVREQTRTEVAASLKPQYDGSVSPKPNVLKRCCFILLNLCVFGIIGYQAGEWIYALTSYNKVAAWAGALFSWSLGLSFAFMIWRRTR